MSPVRTLTLAFVTVLLAAALFYGLIIRNLQQRERELLSRRADLNERLERDREKIRAIQKLEAEAKEALKEMDEGERIFPTSSPMVWIPQRLREYFVRAGFPDPLIRVNSTQPEPELPNYKRIYWTVAFPLSEGPNSLREILDPVANLEQTESILRVVDLMIQPDASNPQIRLAVVTITTLVRQ